MSQLGDETHVQVVHTDGIVEHDASTGRRPGHEVGVLHLELTAVSHDDAERHERRGILQICDSSDVQTESPRVGDRGLEPLTSCVSRKWSERISWSF